MNRDLILRITNSHIHFNEQVFLPINKTNIPHEYLKFREPSTIFWLVSMKEFEVQNGKLKVKVENYSPKNTSKFYEQNPKHNVNHIEFEKFDWTGLEPCLMSHQKSKFKDHLLNSDQQLLNKPEISPKPKIQKEPYIQQKRIPFKQVFREHVKISFDQITFHEGEATFSAKLKKLRGRPLTFTVENEHLMKEFNYIKPWFVKHFGLKKVPVQIILHLIDGSINQEEVRSATLESITPPVVDRIKWRITNDLSSRKEVTVKNTVLSLNELVDSKSSHQEIPFDQTDADILEHFINMDIRNKRQLKYLASSLKNSETKLRYTLNPLFGFIFFQSGDKKNLAIWELLNSHATYVWSADSDTTFNEKIEEQISLIKEIGREEYRKARQKSEMRNDLDFYVLNHRRNENGDEFPDWKRRLERVTTH